MKKNVGRTDRIIRIVVGIVLLALAILVQTTMATWLQVLLVVIGALLVVTGIFAICPLYIVLKMNTLGK